MMCSVCTPIYTQTDNFTLYVPAFISLFFFVEWTDDMAKTIINILLC